MEDREIVALYLARDEQALALTAQKYGRQLRAISRQIVQDVPTAEECENDTYLKAWNAIPPHRPEDYLFAFLARIIRNLSISRCRSRGRLKRSAYLTELSDELLNCIPAPGDPDGELERIALGQSISRYLRTLPPVTAQVFVRRYWYLDTVAQLARRFSLRQNTVKSMLFRTRNGLRAYLIQEGYVL